MTGKKKVSKHIEKAKYRIAGLKSIDPSLDLGQGMSIEAYETLINQAEQSIEEYNTAAAGISDMKKEAEAAEKTLADYSERMLYTIAGRFGTKSTEYGKAGGTVRSGQRKKKTDTPTTPTPVA